jgi:hypothetical protein
VATEIILLPTEVMPGYVREPAPIALFVVEVVTVVQAPAQPVPPLCPIRLLPDA